MTDTQLLAIEAMVLIAVVMMLAGIFISQRNRRLKEVKPKIKSNSAPVVTRSLVNTIGKSLVRETATTTTAQMEAIVVTCDPESGDWWVEVNGTRYHDLKDIHDDQAAHKVLSALSGLQRFAGSIPITSTTRAEPITRPSKLDSRPAPNSATIELGIPKFPAPKDSILDQIENILQRKLIKNPELAERHIHIGEDSDGSLQLEVDQDFYKAPDDVPDAAVRAVIKAAIRDWEQS